MRIQEYKSPFHVNVDGTPMLLEGVSTTGTNGGVRDKRNTEGGKDRLTYGVQVFVNICFTMRKKYIEAAKKISPKT